MYFLFPVYSRMLDMSMPLFMLAEISAQNNAFLLPLPPLKGDSSFLHRARFFPLSQELAWMWPESQPH